MEAGWWRWGDEIERLSEGEKKAWRWGRRRPGDKGEVGCGRRSAKRLESCWLRRTMAAVGVASGFGRLPQDSNTNLHGPDVKVSPAVASCTERATYVPQARFTATERCTQSLTRISCLRPKALGAELLRSSLRAYRKMTRLRRAVSFRRRLTRKELTREIPLGMGRQRAWRLPLQQQHR